MKLEPFEMERMQSTYENQVRFNLSESGVNPLRLDELEPNLILVGGLHALHRERLELHGVTVSRFLDRSRSPTPTDERSAPSCRARPSTAFLYTAPLSQRQTPDLARIPAGDFLMGAPDVEEDERPVHRVYVSEFSISRFSVTQDDYSHFV